MDYQEQAKVMKAFCDENRLRILEQLRGGEQCACKLLEHLVIGQSALSYHMKILVESGVVAEPGMRQMDALQPERARLRDRAGDAVHPDYNDRSAGK